MYAIVRTGGKQYRVEEGRSLVVDRLAAEEGAAVELSDVLLIAENGNITIGTPVIEGARVVAHVEANGRAKKIIVFKYKSKVRTRKKTGHRQAFTKLAVQEILLPGQESKAATRRPEAEAAAPPAEAVAETTRRPRLRRAAPKAAPAPKPKPAAKPKAAAPKKKAAKPQAKKAVPRTSDKPAAKKPSRRPILRRKKKE